jgi:uncharacterized protein (DUF305 family)
MRFGRFIACFITAKSQNWIQIITLLSHFDMKRLIDMKTSLILVSIALAACTPSKTEEEVNSRDHSTAPAGTSKRPSDKAYLAANAKMHADMNIALTGDADSDFMRGMIPHHEGAVAMARVVLEYGMMRSWLAKNGKAAAGTAKSGHENH